MKRKYHPHVLPTERRFDFDDSSLRTGNGLVKYFYHGDAYEVVSLRLNLLSHADITGRRGKSHVNFTKAVDSLVDAQKIVSIFKQAGCSNKLSIFAVKFPSLGFKYAMIF